MMMQYICDNEESCKLLWNLDNFNDYEPDDESDRYEQYEEQEEEYEKSNPLARTYHKGDKINQHGGVSALCFKRPRTISNNVRWTTDDRAVTCKKCLAIIGADRQKTER